MIKLNFNIFHNIFTFILESYCTTKAYLCYYFKILIIANIFTYEQDKDENGIDPQHRMIENECKRFVNNIIDDAVKKKIKDDSIENECKQCVNYIVDCVISKNYQPMMKDVENETWILISSSIPS
jgi:hypothetical protein